MKTTSADKRLVDFWFALSAKERANEFIDTSTAAELAAVSQRTIRFWIDDGLIQALKVGKKYQIQKRSVKDYIVHCEDEAE
jgi:excisionase family DNA binding protein